MGLGNVPARTAGGFHVVVEAPRGATAKLKHDPALDVLVANRPLPRGFAYPCARAKDPRVLGWRGPDAAERLLGGG